MRIPITVSVMLWAAVVSPACAQTQAIADSQPPSITLPADLDRVLRDYERAWKSGDAANVAALFAVDGFVLASGRSPVRGRTAITKAYTGMAGGDLRLRAFAYATGDTVGYILGAYTYGDAKTDMGKFTVTLRRPRNGRWELFSDMDNGNARRQGGASLPSPTPNGNVSPEVIAAVKRELEARYAENEAGFFARDPDRVMRLRHPAFHTITPDGNVNSREQMYQRTRAFIARIERFDSLSETITALTVAGDTAHAMVDQRTTRQQRFPDGSLHEVRTSVTQRESWIRRRMVGFCGVWTRCSPDKRSSMENRHRRPSSPSRIRELAAESRRRLSTAGP